MKQPSTCLGVEKYGENCSKVAVIAGRCASHYRIFRHLECQNRKKERDKVKKAINPDQEDNQRLHYWYSDRMQECTGKCENCGEPIWVSDRHSSIAHVLPKRKNHGFPSVATHPLNKLELGPRCGCHNKYDVSWWSAKKMKIFPKATEIALQLYPLLTREEQARFPEVFQNVLDGQYKL